MNQKLAPKNKLWILFYLVLIMLIFFNSTVIDEANSAGSKLFKTLKPRPIKPIPKYFTQGSKVGLAIARQDYRENELVRFYDSKGINKSNYLSLRTYSNLGGTFEKRISYIFPENIDFLHFINDQFGIDIYLKELINSYELVSPCNLIFRRPLDDSTYAFFSTMQFSYGNNKEDNSMFYNIDENNSNIEKLNIILIDTLPITIQDQNFYLIAAMNYNNKKIVSAISNYLNVIIIRSLLDKATKPNRCNILYLKSNHYLSFNLYFVLHADYYLASIKEQKSSLTKFNSLITNITSLTFDKEVGRCEKEIYYEYDNVYKSACPFHNNKKAKDLYESFEKINNFLLNYKKALLESEGAGVKP